MSIGEERYGIECRECDETASSVVDTRESHGRIRRRRQCPNGHRVSTVEYVAGDMEDVLDAAEAVRASVDALVSAMLRASPVIERRAAKREREAA